MKVSVAVCTYQGEQFLAEQLDSIARQTRRPDEVVLLDDCSTDATVDIARSVVASSGLPCRIQINERRLGLEENFSQAMLRTTGDVVFFCDQDDVWKPQKIERMLAPFSHDNEVTLVYSDGEIVGPKLEPTGYTLFGKNPQKHLEDGDNRNVGQRLKEGHAPGIKASSLAFSARVRDLAGPLPEGVTHDSWIAFFGYALGKVVAIPEVLHVYRRHDRTSGKSSSNALIDGLQQARKTPRNVMLKEKARLAQCLYQRMCDLEREQSGNVRFNERFFTLREDVRQAARTLGSRSRIVQHPGRIARTATGLWSFGTGDYIAVPGMLQKIRTLWRDLRG